ARHGRGRLVGARGRGRAVLLSVLAGWLRDRVECADVCHNALNGVRWCERCDGAAVRPRVRGAMVRTVAPAVAPSHCRTVGRTSAPPHPRTVAQSSRFSFLLRYRPSPPPRPFTELLPARNGEF